MIVMTSLVPVIHDFLPVPLADEAKEEKQSVDGRHKAGHDV
jgi:hypothetical protein